MDQGGLAGELYALTVYRWMEQPFASCPQFNRTVLSVLAVPFAWFPALSVINAGAYSLYCLVSALFGKSHHKSSAAAWVVKGMVFVDIGIILSSAILPFLDPPKAVCGGDRASVCQEAAIATYLIAWMHAHTSTVWRAHRNTSVAAAKTATSIIVYLACIAAQRQLQRYTWSEIGMGVAVGALCSILTLHGLVYTRSGSRVVAPTRRSSSRVVAATQRGRVRKRIDGDDDKDMVV